MQPRLWPTRKVWASGLPMCWFVGIGHGEGDCLCAGAFDLGAKPVKPVAVRIAFKAMYDINASIHVFPPSDGLRLLSKSLPISVYYTMFVYVLLFAVW